MHSGASKLTTGPLPPTMGAPGIEAGPGAGVGCAGASPAPFGLTESVSTSSLVNPGGLSGAVPALVPEGRRSLKKSSSIPCLQVLRRGGQPRDVIRLARAQFNRGPWVSCRYRVQDSRSRAHSVACSTLTTLHHRNSCQIHPRAWHQGRPDAWGGPILGRSSRALAAGRQGLPAPAVHPHGRRQ